MFKTPPNDGWLEKAIALENEFEISAGANFQVGAATASTSEEAVSVNPMQTAFAVFMHKLRIAHQLTLEQLAEKIAVDREQLLLIEKRVGFKAPPRTLERLASFYKLPLRAVVQMAGAVTQVNPLLARNAVQFAAQSDSFEQLTKDEKKLLVEFVKLVRDIK
jgi:transcriptional regulator with XRE-family HTH domain